MSVPPKSVVTESGRGATAGWYDEHWAQTNRVDQHHRCRILAIERALGHAPAPAGKRRRILELGCGSGIVCAALARHGEVVGIDQSSVGVETARRRLPGGRFEVGVLPAIDLDQVDFDVCVLTQVIEHFAPHEQRTLLENARAKTRRDGLLVLTTPNRPVSSRMHFGTGELQPIENWFDAGSIRRLVENAGWEVIEVSSAFSFFPVLASRSRIVRGLRYGIYDLLRLRAPLEALLAHRGYGDALVVVARAV